MALTVPECLKRAIGPYIKRADEFESIVSRDAMYGKLAYYCRLHAIETAMKALGALNGADQATAGAFLNDLMSKLENDRVTYGVTEAQKGEDLARLTAFALSTFKKADELDQSGFSDRNTALLYSNVGNLLDVVRALGGGDPKLDSMTKYAKGRAAEIANAIRTGAAVMPPRGSDMSGLSFPELPSFDDLPGATPASASPTTQYSMATPPTTSTATTASTPSHYNQAPAPSVTPAVAPAHVSAPVSHEKLPSFGDPTGFPTGSISNTAAANMFVGGYTGPVSLPPVAQPVLQYHASNGSVGSAAAPSRGLPSSGKSRMAPPVLHDATEFTKHALAALKTEDAELAVQFLHKALETLQTRSSY